MRGNVFQREVSHLTDEVWAYAVSQALKCERWFPTPAAILEYAAEYEPPLDIAGYLPARTPHSIEEQRAEFRKGLSTFRDELAKHGIHLEDGARSMK